MITFVFFWFLTSPFLRPDVLKQWIILIYPNGHACETSTKMYEIFLSKKYCWLFYYHSAGWSCLWCKAMNNWRMKINFDLKFLGQTLMPVFPTLHTLDKKSACKKEILFFRWNNCTSFKLTKETPRRRITCLSSLNEISTDQLGNGWGCFGNLASRSIQNISHVSYIASYFFTQWAGSERQSIFLPY